TGLQDDLRDGRRRLERRGDELGDRRRMLVERVPDRESAAQVENRRLPAVDRRSEPRERRRGGSCRAGIAEQRADVDVKSEDPAVLRDQRSGLLLGESELRAVMTGTNRLVRVGVDAERDSHEQALDPSRAGAVELVGSVEDDERVAGGPAVGAGLGTDRFLAVDDERRPVFGGELGGADASDRELALVVDRRGVREELEHGRPILPRSERELWTRSCSFGTDRVPSRRCATRVADLGWTSSRGRVGTRITRACETNWATELA